MEQDALLPFESFLSKLVSLCTKHIPAESAFAAQKSSPLPSVAAVVSNSTTALMQAATMAMAATATALTTCSPCCSEAIGDLINTYGFGAVAGAMRVLGKPTPRDWMCELCCRIGHKKTECTYPPLPEQEREQKLQAHCAKKLQHTKQRNA